MENKYSKWLRQKMDEAGVTQYRLAKVSGVPQPTISRIYKGLSKNPQSDTMETLSAALDQLARERGEADDFELTEPPKIHIEEAVGAYHSSSAPQPKSDPGSDHAPDLFAKKGEHELQFVGRMDAWDGDTELEDDEVELPLFREVELAAGDGSTAVIENHGAKLRFSRATLRRQGVIEDNAACAFVKGNSMEPMMGDGACIGINTADKSIHDGKIYAIDQEGMLRVKMLYRLPGGGLKVVSMNSEEHPTEEYDQDYVAHNIRIKGRVFWYSGLL